MRLVTFTLQAMVSEQTADEIREMVSEADFDTREAMRVIADAQPYVILQRVDE